MLSRPHNKNKDLGNAPLSFKSNQTVIIQLKMSLVQNKTEEKDRDKK